LRSIDVYLFVWRQQFYFICDACKILVGISDVQMQV
jgi:hypothetical protein